MKPVRPGCAAADLVEFTLDVSRVELALAEEIASGWETPSWVEEAGPALRLHLFFPAATAPSETEVRGRLGAGGLSLLALARGPAGPGSRTASGRAGFRPLAVGRRWRIESPWFRGRPAAGGRITLVVNPGTGFGTGRHPSTRLCLKMLEEMPAGTSGVLDLGCGSGILSIAALRAGARRAIAVDSDPEALENCHQNLALNGRSAAAEVICADLAELPPAGMPWVLANLEERIFARLLDAVLAQVPPGGTLVLGGLETDELPGQLARCAAAGLVGRRRRTEAGWAAALLDRPD